MDEIDAVALYTKHYAPVDLVGFVTNDQWGFTIGYSPDGLVGDDGLIECKSRRQKFQIETLVSGAVPDEHMIQLQTGLLVTGRAWIDYVSYSAGLPMVTIRVEPNAIMQTAIVHAAEMFEARLQKRRTEYGDLMPARRTIPTERKIEKDMHL